MIFCEGMFIVIGAVTRVICSRTGMRMIKQGRETPVVLAQKEDDASVVLLDDPKRERVYEHDNNREDNHDGGHGVHSRKTGLHWLRPEYTASEQVTRAPILFRER